jgi:hypothetical protein
MERAGIVEQAQEEGADAFAVLVSAESGDDTVGGSLVLDLEHDPLVGEIVKVRGLDDHAIESRPFEAREPVRSHIGVLGGRCQVDRRLGSLQQLLEHLSALPVRRLHVRGVVVCQEVEGDERRRCRRRELVDPLGRRVDALGQRVEIESRRTGDDHLAVDDDAIGQLAAERLDELGEVSGQGLLVAAAEFHIVAVTEHDATEPVPFRLVVQAVFAGQITGELGEHGRHGRRDGEFHAASACDDAHETSSSAVEQLTTRSKGTSAATAFRHPRPSHSS